jgi:chromate transporter
MSNLAEVAALFLKLGFTAFGGPAAHIGIMHNEVVARRKWLTDEGFLDLLGATNLIPGPNSTEMAIHIGYLRAGIVGAWKQGAQKSSIGADGRSGIRVEFLRDQ